MQEFTDEFSVVINAPASDIYIYVADFPRHPEWNHQLHSMTQQSKGAIQVGTILHADDKLAKEPSLFSKYILTPLFKLIVGTPDYTIVEVTAMEPYSRLSWKVLFKLNKDTLLATTTWEMLFEETSGSTQLTLQYYYIVNAVNFGTSHFTGEQYKTDIPQNLKRLKAHVEKEASTE